MLIVYELIEKWKKEGCNKYKGVSTKELKNIAQKTAYETDKSILSGDVISAAKKGRENAVVNAELDRRNTMAVIGTSTAISLGYAAVMYILVNKLPD